MKTREIIPIPESMKNAKVYFHVNRSGEIFIRNVNTLENKRLNISKSEILAFKKQRVYLFPLYAKCAITKGQIIIINGIVTSTRYTLIQ